MTSFDNLEILGKAFWRKLPVEAILGIESDYLDCENMAIKKVLCEIIIGLYNLLPGLKL